MARFIRAAVPSFVLVSISSSMFAQTVLRQWTGTAQEPLGAAVAVADDVDGDGAADLLMTAGDKVRVVSSATGLTLREHAPPLADSSFGASIGGGGDVDGDGVGDVIVGAPSSDVLGTDSGSVWIYSGASGQLRMVRHGLVPLDGLGREVGFAGDVDGDGRAEFFASSDSGRVRVFDGASGVMVHDLTPFSTLGSFGRGIALVGDLDGDGLRDLATLEGDAFGGANDRVRVFSLPSGTQLLGYTTSAAVRSVASAGDVDGNGRPDLVLGLRASTGMLARFALLSGTNGTLIQYSTGEFPACCSQFARAAGSGDLNGDGSADEFLIAVPEDSANGSAAGRVFVQRGDQEIAHLDNVGDATGDHFGSALAIVPDTDGDGIDEILVSAPSDGAPGRVLLMSAVCTPPRSYCTAKTNSLGCVPAIGSSGTPDLNGPFAFVLSASNVINQKNGLFFWSRARQEVPFQGGTLCVGAPVRRTQVTNSGGSASGDDCTGVVTYVMNTLYMWLQGFELGDELYGQFWYRDPQHSDGTGVGLSDALAFRICY